MGGGRGKGGGAREEGQGRGGPIAMEGGHCMSEEEGIHNLLQRKNIDQ